MRALQSDSYMPHTEHRKTRLRRAAALAAWLCVGLLALGAALPAEAQDAVRNVRVSRNPTFDRIVFDLSSPLVDATQARSGEDLYVKLTTPAPEVRGAVRDQLAKIKVTLEESDDGGTLVAIDLDGRNSRIFRLASPERLVLDLALDGQGPLAMPDDAGVVPKLPLDMLRPRREESVAATPPSRTREPAADIAPLPRREEPPVREVQDTEPIDVAVVPQRETRPVEAPRETPPPPAIEEPEVIEDPEPSPVAAIDPVEEPSRRAEDIEDDPADGGWVLVRAIEIAGLDLEDGVPPSEDDLLNLILPVSPERGGYVAARKDKPVRRLPLRALTGDDRNGRRLSGSLLQVIVEEIAAVYSREERIGTKVEIRPADYLQLKNPSSDGKLVITVIEATKQLTDSSAVR